MATALTIAQLLELHPFPAEHANKKRIERLWVFDLPGTPAMLWPFISDTSRMNRALGTAQMTFVEKNGLRHGTQRAVATRAHHHGVLRFRIVYRLASGIGELGRIGNHAKIELSPSPPQDIVECSARFSAG